MWLVHVICSGRECSEELELVAESLDELDRLNCDCGYGFAVLSVAEASPVDLQSADVVELDERRPPDTQRAAA